MPATQIAEGWFLELKKTWFLNLRERTRIPVIRIMIMTMMINNNNNNSVFFLLTAESQRICNKSQGGE